MDGVYHRSTEIDFRMPFSWQPSINLAPLIPVYNISITNSSPTGTAWELCYKLMKICEYLMDEFKDPWPVITIWLPLILVTSSSDTDLLPNWHLPIALISADISSVKPIECIYSKSQRKVKKSTLGMVTFWNQTQSVMGHNCLRHLCCFLFCWLDRKTY